MTSTPRLSTYWVTCADGLETLLQEELQELGVQHIERLAGRLIFKGTLEHAYRICMWSRLASRVLMPIHTYELEHSHDARDVAEELYEGAISFDWSLVFAPQSTFAIRLHAEREIKVNTQFATLRAKDGVVDSFMEAVGRRQVLIRNNLKLHFIFWRVKPSILTASTYQVTRCTNAATVAI
jgi:23S rRNA (guanine2445-N2)-methyltransferase / 23S rRNA (guanine2069-N7)-methyltransferase